MHFTRRLVRRLEPGREYRAWIDGPFGPCSVKGWRSSAEMSDYGHVFMAATGIGIAAQIPYIKELLDRRRDGLVRTQRISLVWQVDRAGDWESAHEWLQSLVEQDNGYLLKVIVYDELQSPSEKDPILFGHHDLISVYGGKVDWREQLTREMEDKIGRLLVAVSARRPVRKEILKEVRNNVDQGVEWFELEFEPWERRGSWWSSLMP